MFSPFREPQSDNVRVFMFDALRGVLFIVVKHSDVNFVHVKLPLGIVGEASNGTPAIKLARSHRHVVVVMDVSMQVMSGVEAAAEIRVDMPDVKVIGPSMHEEGELSSSIRQAGAVA